MKKIFLLSVFCLLASFAMSQEAIREKQVPADILMDFKLRFHEADEVIWYHQTQTHYGARFRVRGSMGECIYDDTNQWVQSEEQIHFRELPDSAIGYLQTNYAEYQAPEVLRVTTRKYGVLYDVRATNGIKTFVITFDMDGDLVDTQEAVEKTGTAQEPAEEKKKGLRLPQWR
jgi:hypothetical protein